MKVTIDVEQFLIRLRDNNFTTIGDAIQEFKDCCIDVQGEFPEDIFAEKSGVKAPPVAKEVVEDVKPKKTRKKRASSKKAAAAAEPKTLDLFKTQGAETAEPTSEAGAMAIPASIPTSTAPPAPAMTEVEAITAISDLVKSGRVLDANHWATAASLTGVDIGSYSTEGAYPAATLIAFLDKVKELSGLVD